VGAVWFALSGGRLHIAGGERLFTADPWGNRVELLASAQR
jgi:hypothetical protein